MKNIGKKITSLTVAAAMAMSLSVSAFAYAPQENAAPGMQQTQMVQMNQQDGQQPPEKPDGQQDGQQSTEKTNANQEKQQDSASDSTQSDATEKKTTRLTRVKLSKVKNVKGKKLSVQWKKNTAGEGYQIQYATDKKFKKNVKTVTVSKNTTTRKTISGLTKGKTYYVRVRAVNGENTSGWSATKSVKVKK